MTGSTGPQGATGVQGVTGATGPQGSTGTAHLHRWAMAQASGIGMPQANNNTPFGFTNIPNSFISVDNTAGASGAGVLGTWMGAVCPTGGTGAGATYGIWGRVAVVVDGVQGPAIPFYIGGQSGFTMPETVQAQNIQSRAAGVHTMYTAIAKDAGNQLIYIGASSIIGQTTG